MSGEKKNLCDANPGFQGSQCTPLTSDNRTHLVPPFFCFPEAAGRLGARAKASDDPTNDPPCYQQRNGRQEDHTERVPHACPNPRCCQRYPLRDCPRSLFDGLTFPQFLAYRLSPLVTFLYGGIALPGGQVLIKGRPDPIVGCKASHPPTWLACPSIHLLRATQAPNPYSTACCNTPSIQ
jgi:hypothetical protein